MPRAAMGKMLEMLLKLMNLCEITGAGSGQYSPVPPYSPVIGQGAPSSPANQSTAPSSDEGAAPTAASLANQSTAPPSDDSTLTVLANHPTAQGAPLFTMAPPNGDRTLPVSQVDCGEAGYASFAVALAYFQSIPVRNQAEWYAPFYSFLTSFSFI